MPYFGQIYKQYPRLLVDLFTFMQSKWWTRVWTLQEMALPFGEVRFMSETDTERCQRNTITMDDLINSCANALGAMYYDRHAFREFPSDHMVRESLECWIIETSKAREFGKHRAVKGVERLVNLFSSFSFSFRRCYDPVDYVYGVLGLLQIKISRMTDPTAVWQRFLYELDNYLEDFKGTEFPVFGGFFTKAICGIDGSAYEVRLEDVRNMREVYEVIISYEYILHDD
ncbi:predicted protein [Lichtheimia corymbifera JMRC:FSU:9682]|uniref:Heterokaryon incompatibility domain-containing protein n=1 Tax=Lichtheimia corymbifera JMRC:FSU:9682 TaxID=1263082 RepID=A0A068SF59_9FUNG|nr:predicted protein [Lichtheimia corymbifera JMRC:FSU:9682]